MAAEIPGRPAWAYRMAKTTGKRSQQAAIAPSSLRRSDFPSTELRTGPSPIRSTRRVMSHPPKLRPAMKAVTSNPIC